METRWTDHKMCLEGRMVGKRPRGRKRIMMMHDTKDGRSYFRTKEDAEDRELWRRAP